MGASRDGGFVGCGGELGEDEEVDREKPSSCVPSKLLDGGAESSTCGICSIFVQTRGLLDCCHHLFCFSCITEWFTVSNLCPLCKCRSRFITPQMLSGDTGCWERLESGYGSVSRDEGPSDEDGHPVSFPPYFIDEEAVLCLEGDACLVRAGLLDFDAEGNAASDTSVACDLCDCWYHGGCVNFQHDQSSFHCPRCLAKENDGTSVDASKLSTVVSSEEKVSSTVTSLHKEVQSANAAQTTFGSSSVAIEDPEEGESHVSISLRHIPNGQPVKTQPTVEDSEREIMWSPIREPFAVPTYGAAWPSVPEPARRPQHVTEVFPSSARESTRNVPYFEEELWSPTREPSGTVPQFQEELWSPTRESGNDLSFVGARSKFNAASGKTANPQRSESRGLHNATGPRAVVTPRPDLHNSSARVERHPAAVTKIRNASEVSSGMLPINTSNNMVQSMSLIKGGISIDVDRLQVAVEQLRKGKRKVLQEDEKNIDLKDLPEMPRKIARKSTRKIDSVDDKSLSATKDFAKKVTTDLIVGEQTDVQDVNLLEPMIKADALDDKTAVSSDEIKKRLAIGVVGREETDVQHVNIVEPNIKTEVEVLDDKAPVASKDILKKVAMDVVAVGQVDTNRLDDSAVKTEPTEISNKEQLATAPEDPVAPEKKVEVPSLEVCSEVDVMDIVSDPRMSLVKDTSNKSGPTKGVRTRIIMHREPDIKDSERPSLVERIRQQMRDTAGHGAGEDLGKVEVSDDRFIAAFKAAQTRSYEKSKEVKSVSSRQQSSGRLWKVLDKKYSGTGVRDNLTRKLYAGGGRKCWDRDWDISFWRERDPHQKRGRREAEGEVDGSVKKDARGTDAQRDSEDVDFFNRLYVADTSLFPRNEDVKPLSVQANHAEGKSAPEPERNRTGKILHPHVDRVNPTHGFKDTTQQSPPVQGVSGVDKLSENSHRGKVVDPPPSKIVKKALKPSAALKETSLKARTTSGSGKSGGTPSAALTVQNKYPEVTPAVGDVKKDKRQWALEILARKEGKLSNPSASGKTEGCGSVTKDNPFHLLLQLPVDMRPLILGDSRRSKVPPAVRQVQLNRFVEQELRRANLAVIEKNAECEDAIDRAVSREEELCKSSNSKGVYINRCVRALAITDYEVKVVETSLGEDHDDSEARSEEFSRPEEDEAVRKALEDAGLMDSPVGDPASKQDADSKEVSLDIKSKIGSMNSGSKVPRPVENNWVENVLEVENADLDIYGDFEFSSDDGLDATSSRENPQRLKLIPATSVHSSDGKAKSGSLMVVLTTGSCPSDAALESGEGEVPAKELSSKQPVEGHGGWLSCKEDGGLRASTSPTVEAVTCGPTLEPIFEDADDMYDNLELNLNPVLSAEVIAQLRAESFAESKETHEEPTTLPAMTVYLKKRDESDSILKGDAAASENNSEDDCMKFADIDRRIENIRRSKAVNGDPQRSKKSKGRVHREAKRTSETNVQTQVEIYVNQHLKPLYRSQVISAEQFKWTVSKTAAKVMEYHGNAVSADFLISEGSKVKKLADQYLQTFAHRKT